MYRKKKICQKRDKLYGKKEKKKNQPCIQALLASDLINYLCHKKESRKLS